MVILLFNCFKHDRWQINSLTVYFYIVYIIKIINKVDYM